MSEHDQVDLQKMSQKELLIVTHEKVKDIAESVKVLTEKQSKHEVRISLMENKVMMWGAAFGLIGAAVVQVIILFLKL